MVRKDLTNKKLFMRTKSLISASLLSLTTLFHAEAQSGIYLTATDLKNNTLQFASDGCTHCLKVRTNDFFSRSSTLTVISGGEKHRLKKSEVFGYKDDDGNTFRFFNDDAYKIEEAGSIFIYARQRNVAQSKGFKVVNDYYFSDGTGDIYPLTVGNVQRIFAGNNNFIAAVKAYNGRLADYDQANNTYAINLLYRMSNAK
jgi:hypothetical protein